MAETITTWYLEMFQREEFKPKFGDFPELEIVEVEIKDYRYNRFLYSLVGEQWGWTDKLKWSKESWVNYAENENLHTYVAYYSGTPAGYFELLKQPNLNVKIEYFGLSPKFIGKGLGSHLLSSSIEQAWNLKANRVWVHTCSLDHPAALNNYKARGFKIYETKVDE